MKSVISPGPTGAIVSKTTASAHNANASKTGFVQPPVSGGVKT